MLKKLNVTFVVLCQYFVAMLSLNCQQFMIVYFHYTKTMFYLQQHKTNESLVFSRSLTANLKDLMLTH